jgi:hypothetical protein
VTSRAIDQDSRRAASNANHSIPAILPLRRANRQSKRVERRDCRRVARVRDLKFGISDEIAADE